MSDENSPAIHAPTFLINDKGLHNSYLREHLLGKGISYALIRKCLSEGKEVTSSLRYRKPGCRYFMMPITRSTDIPGRFILPSSSGHLGNKISNWNTPCEYKFRHGKLVPVIKREDIPDWLLRYATTFWVIIEKNELPDGSLLNHDGPTEEDEEGSWFVVTAHFGPPSTPKPRVPKNCNNADELRLYLINLDNWTREQSSTIYVDLEDDGQRGPSTEEKKEISTEEEFKKIVLFQQEQIDDLKKEVARLRQIITKRMKRNTS